MSSLYNNQWYDSAHIEAQYFADGSVRTAHDLYDPRFTRSYSFDHVGSMSQASSGVYNQTFQHDAFGNTTNRQSVIWTEFDSFVATWINGRNQNPVWQYDANGTVRFDDDFEYTYDAKGVNSKVRNLGDNLWISQTVNPEELMARRSTGTPTATLSTTYYLRSTVLGGKVVAEYNSAAQQQKQYAYLDGQLLATDDANNFYLEHKNPLTGSRGQSVSYGMWGGGYYATAEPDSSGVVDVGFSDPNDVPPLPPEEPDIASILGGLNGECRVQGIQSTFGCYLAQRMLAGQTALRCPNDDCDAHLITVSQTIGGKIAATSKFFSIAGDSGWDGSLDGTYGWFPPLSNKIDLNDPNQAKRIVSQIPGLLKNEYLTRVGSQSQLYTSEIWAERLGRGEERELYDSLRKLLRNETCTKFITAMLWEAAKESGNDPITTDMLELFSLVLQQNGAAFGTELLTGRGGTAVLGYSGVSGSVMHGNAQILLSTSIFGDKPTLAKVRELFVLAALGELTHIAGQKSYGKYNGSIGYGDEGLVRAAYVVSRQMNLGGLEKKIGPPPASNPNLPVASPVYHRALETVCGPK
jgi:hypothetical protein